MRLAEALAHRRRLPLRHRHDGVELARLEAAQHGGGGAAAHPLDVVVDRPAVGGLGVLAARRRRRRRCPSRWRWPRSPPCGPRASGRPAPPRSSRPCRRAPCARRCWRRSSGCRWRRSSARLLPFSVILSGWFESPSANWTCPAASACTTLAPPPGTTKSGRLEPLLLEELLLGRHQVLAVDKGGDAMGGGEGLDHPLGRLPAAGPIASCRLPRRPRPPCS